ncbi:hypothetical protein N865_15835 [Intrasporangium oryzae NRRL B-24470]|uniref:Polyketide cyclase n=1 Tax=Intrasporangium oryzae NRRL B-24470 TaxID=1386089 RepID=W9G309_9MICO|nr:hypothetical protein N865_15835 [Intrasporangium oryzae NRRL B-24470]
MRLRATGPAAPATVWERYADTRLWPTWSPQVRRVEVGEGSPRLRPGLAGQVVGTLGVRVTFVVDEVDEGAMTWSWHVRVGPVRMALDHGVRAHDDGTLTVLRITAPTPVAAAYAPLAQIALQRLVRR